MGFADPGFRSKRLKKEKNMTADSIENGIDTLRKIDEEERLHPSPTLNGMPPEILNRIFVYSRNLSLPRVCRHCYRCLTGDLRLHAAMLSVLVLDNDDVVPSWILGRRFITKDLLQTVMEMQKTYVSRNMEKRRQPVVRRVHRDNNLLMEDEPLAAAAIPPFIYKTTHIPAPLSQPPYSKRKLQILGYLVNDLQLNFKHPTRGLFNAIVHDLPFQIVELYMDGGAAFDPHVLYTALKHRRVDIASSIISKKMVNINDKRMWKKVIRDSDFFAGDFLLNHNARPPISIVKLYYKLRSTNNIPDSDVHAFSDSASTHRKRNEQLKRARIFDSDDKQEEDETPKKSKSKEISH